MSCPAGSPDQVADYVDGLLDAPRAHALERHLIACTSCRAEVDQQRALIQRLRQVPVDRTRHEHLMAGLLDLARTSPTYDAPAVAVSPTGPAVVTCTAPPHYVSARRSVACAAAAVAGCIGVAIVAAQVPGQGTTGHRTDPAVTNVRHVRPGPATDPAVPHRAFVVDAVVHD